MGPRKTVTITADCETYALFAFGPIEQWRGNNQKLDQKTKFSASMNGAFCPTHRANCWTRMGKLNTFLKNFDQNVENW